MKKNKSIVFTVAATFLVCVVRLVKLAYVPIALLPFMRDQQMNTSFHVQMIALVHTAVAAVVEM